MKRTIAAVSVLLLAGCASNAHLIAQNGKRYPLEFSHGPGGAMSADIEGVHYAGRYIASTSAGFGPGGRVMMGVGNSVQGVMTASNGDALNCALMRSGFTVMGQCQNNAGQSYTVTTE